MKYLQVLKTKKKILIKINTTVVWFNEPIKRLRSEDQKTVPKDNFLISSKLE